MMMAKTKPRKNPRRRGGKSGGYKIKKRRNPNPRKAKDIRMKDAGDYFVVEIKDGRYVRGYKQRTYRKKVTTVMALQLLAACPKLYVRVCKGVGQR